MAMREVDVSEPAILIRIKRLLADIAGLTPQDIRARLPEELGIAHATVEIHRRETRSGTTVSDTELD